MSRSSQSICPATRLRHTRRHGKPLLAFILTDTLQLTAVCRAGCNFSAISGTDANALKWDRAGYAHLTKLASESSAEAFVEYTSSTEYWEQTVPHDKIKHLAGYLKDVRPPRSPLTHARY